MLCAHNDTTKRCLSRFSQDVIVWNEHKIRICERNIAFFIVFGRFYLFDVFLFYPYDHFVVIFRLNIYNCASEYYLFTIKGIEHHKLSDHVQSSILSANKSEHLKIRSRVSVLFVQENDIA